MHFRSQVTIRKNDGSLLAPIVLLHEDDDILSGVLFLQSIGRQMSWQRNGELVGLQLQLGLQTENASDDPAPSCVPALVTSSPEVDLCSRNPEHDFEAFFSSLDSPACRPNGAIRS